MLKKSLQSLTIITLVVTPTLVGFPSLSSPSADNSQDLKISLRFPPTRGDRSAPQTTTGAGTRSDDIACLNLKEGDLPLVALMPNRENHAKTATATPTLYWYIPSTAVKNGEFVLIDANGREIYYTALSLPNQAGIVKLTIPEIAGLQPNQRYSWYFMIVCDPIHRNRDRFVGGELDYIELDDNTVNRLRNTTGLDQAEIYANSQIWAETLNIMAQLRSENPSEWLELLQSVGLEKIAPFPFLEIPDGNPATVQGGAFRLRRSSCSERSRTTSTFSNFGIIITFV